MHFSQAAAIIQSQVGIIKNVQVHYSDLVSIDRNECPALYITIV